MSQWSKALAQRPSKQILPLVAIALAASPVSAQEPGDTVRISGAIIGEFVRFDAVGVSLQGHFLPYSEVTSLEVQTGFERKLAKGAITGFAIGAVTGSMAMLTWADNSIFTDGQIAALGALFGGAVGAPVGLLVGYLRGGPTWAPLPLPGRRAGLVLEWRF